MKEVNEAVEKFMAAWENQDHNVMHTLCTKTYKVANTAQQVRSLLPHIIEKHEIGKPKKSTDEVYDVPINIIIKGSAKARKVVARVICETAPWKASKDGEWGVNPISVLKDLNP